MFSPNGSRILAGHWDRFGSGGFGQLWDAATIQRLGKPLRHRKRVHAVAFSPDGSRFLTGSLDGTMQQWDAATLKPMGKPVDHQSNVMALAYNPDGKRMLIGLADGTVRLWDLAAQKPIGVPMHHRSIVSSVTFSPDGSLFALCSIDGTARLWDTATQRPIGPSLQHEAREPRGTFSPDGTEFLVTGSEGTVRVWQTASGPLDGNPKQIVLWAEVLIGLEFDEIDGIATLDGPAWHERYRRLQELGTPTAVASLVSNPPKVQTSFSLAMEQALQGRAHLQRGRWNEADVTLARSIQMAGNSSTLRFQVACWWNKLADDHLHSSRHEACERASRRAVALLEKLVGDFPDEPEYRTKLDSQYESLIRLYLIEDRPADIADALSKRTALYEELGEELPSDWASRRKLGDRLVSQGIRLKRRGRLQEAEEHFSRASLVLQTVIVEARDHPEMYHNSNLPQRALGRCYQHLGRIHAFAGRYQEACACFQRAFELDLGNSYSHARFAKFLLATPNTELKDPLLVLQHATIAFELNSENAHAFILGVFGRACYQMGDYVAAVDALDKAISMNQIDSYTHVSCFVLAMAQWRLGHTQEARQAYDKAVDLSEQFTSDEQVKRLRAEAAELLGIKMKKSEAGNRKTENDREPEN